MKLNALALRCGGLVGLLAFLWPWAAMGGPVGWQVELAAGSLVAVGDRGLTLEMLEVRDTRCPTGVVCIWAGHAAVTLQVSRGAADPRIVVVGTFAPPGSDLPGIARVAGVEIRLLQLTPGNSTEAPVPLSSYRATLQVTPLAQ